MRFWELVSAYRSEALMLQRLLDTERWRTPYGHWLEELDRLLNEQRRDVLDADVPVELARAAAAESSMTFSLDADGWLRKDDSVARRSKRQTVTALEVHDRYGGSIIEEVLEYGSAFVDNRQ
jgi:hypothetical protein